jgi:hypothetical protein
VTTPSLSEALPAVTSRLRAAPAAWSFLGLGAAAIAAYFFALPAHSDQQSVFYVVIGLASVVAIWVGATRNLAVGDRLAWRLFALGLVAAELAE